MYTTPSTGPDPNWKNFHESVMLMIHNLNWERLVTIYRGIYISRGSAKYSSEVVHGPPYAKSVHAHDVRYFPLLQSTSSTTTVVAFLIFPTLTNNFNVDSLKGQAVTKQLRCVFGKFLHVHAIYSPFLRRL